MRPGKNGVRGWRQEPALLSFRSLHSIQTLRPFVVHPRYQRAAGAFARPPRFRRPVHSSRGGWHTGRMAGMPSPPPREFRSSVAASVRWLRIPSISTSLPSPLSPHLSSPLLSPAKRRSWYLSHTSSLPVRLSVGRRDVPNAPTSLCAASPPHFWKMSSHGAKRERYPSHPC